MRIKFLVVLFASLIMFVKNSSQTSVNTQFGAVQGSLNGSVVQFLGIPYAKPPVGMLRWKAPQDPVAWTNAISTNSFAPECPQKKFQQGGSTFTLSGNEDCLYLNIWTPQTGTGNRPVLVFIHGGGNQQGSSNEENGGTYMYFGKNLSQRGDAVVVTIQYRLGPLGFLVHPGLEAESSASVAGNYAVMDQILALKWVKNNIAAFGGDPNKVLIFGESAGGVNVGNLMNTPLAAGLFQRACIQSAAPVIGNYNTAKNKGINYVDTYVPTGSDIQKIAYMRGRSSDSIVKYEVTPLSGGAVGMNWQAVIDNSVFFNSASQNFQNGTFNKVPFMIGSNSEEMSLSAPQTVYPFMVTALINASVPSSLQAQATALYPPGTNTVEARKSYVGILTDAQFTSSAKRTAQCVSANQNEPVWRYFFTHKHTLPQLAPLGSYHGMELFYVFNTWENATLGSGILFKPQDDSVQNVMLNYWVNFANTGNPNSAGLAIWPQYQGAADCYLEIKASPDGTQCGIRSAESELWDKSINYLECSSALGFHDFKKDKELVIYPNPTNGIVSIEAIQNAGQAHLSVYDSKGKKLFSSANVNEADLSNFDGGLYFLTIVIEGKTYVGKIIKN